MHRRRLLAATAAALAAPHLAARAAGAAEAPPRGLLVITLKGGNDALNTLVPFHSPQYRRLRPDLALSRDAVVRLDEQRGLNPALAALQGIWEAGDLALVDGVGYAPPSLSHFESMAIWDGGAGARGRLDGGWLGRALATGRVPGERAADAVGLGRDAGPLAATGASTLVLRDPSELARHAGPDPAPTPSRSRALDHVLQVQRTLGSAARDLRPGPAPGNRFPAGAFGRDLRSAVRLLDGRPGVAAARVVLDGFDTHARQAIRHPRLLRQLGEGLTAVREALDATGRWRDTLILVHSEFGRRPAQNGNGGTDHGTAGVMLVLGGRVRGGLVGEPPRLARLDGDGNLAASVDYRRVYATVLEHWWGLPSRALLGGRFEPLALLA